MRQIDAVISAIQQVKPDFQFNHDKGNEIIIGDIRDQVTKLVIIGILNGSVEYSKDKTNIEAITKYVKGMVSNWLRRNKMLNGNTAINPNTPLARIGANDPQLKALKELKKTLNNNECIMETDIYIRKRIAELKNNKQIAKLEEINMDVLPDHIKALLNKG